MRKLKIVIGDFDLFIEDEGMLCSGNREKVCRRNKR